MLFNYGKFKYNISTLNIFMNIHAYEMKFSINFYTILRYTRSINYLTRHMILSQSRRKAQ